MNKFRHILLIVSAFLVFASCGADADLKKADQAYALGEYFDASKLYRKAYASIPSKERAKRGVVAFRLGESYRHISYSARAVAAYQNAVRYRYPDSMVLFHLAQMQHMCGDYKGAAKNYQLFLEKSPQSILARNGAYSCVLAPEWKKNPTHYRVQKAGALNGRRSDFSPMLFGTDSEQMIFTTTRPQVHGDEFSGITGVKNSDLFCVRKDEKGKWLAPEMIEGDVNTDFDEGVSCISPDGKVMYFTRCRTDAFYPRYAEIWKSQRQDASWSAPQQVVISRDTLSSYAHPAVSPDGQWLYFVSDMPGGEGGLDIWRAPILSDGIGAVENLGPSVNTPGNEMFPTFRPNGDLYFSSDGHVSMGGLDVMIARHDSTGNGFLPPVNPRYPLNSLGDDFGLTFEGVHNRGYFSSNRGDARGWDHLYTFELPEIIQTIRGWVYEKDGYELPAAQVYLVGNDGTNLKLSVRTDGSFTQIINPNVDYVLLGTCRGFLNHKEELRVDTVSESTEYTLQFPLASITAPVLVDNIFYAFDSAELSPESAASLDNLAELLRQNPNVTIELSAHCDYRGSADYNRRLSQRRAESVVRYLVKAGIESDRLTPVGYGKDRPKRIRRKLTERYDYLHEDDTLTPEFISALTPEQQEECNQLNRRTEFRVLRTTYGLTSQPK